MFHEDQKTGGLNLSSKTSFILGIVGGILILCSIGFFILLLSVLKGGVSVGSKNNNSYAIAPSAPSPSPSAAAPSVAPTGAVPPVTKDDYIRGSSNAKVTLVEYSDFECPFCKRFHPTMQQLMKEYDGKVKWVYRNFPLSFHANAQKEAEAALCAGDIGGSTAFWNYSDKIFERTTSNGTGFALTALVPLATELGINETKFKNCLDNGKFAARVQQEAAGGSGAGVTGTPGTFIIGKNNSVQLVPGAVPYEQLKTMVDAAL